MKWINYKCGHKSRGVIIIDGTDPLAMFGYLHWAEEEDNLNTRKECFDCYLKRIEIESKNN